MPSRELFEAQSEMYQRSVLLPEGTHIGEDRFGASAPGEVVVEKYGFTAEHVAEEAHRLVASFVHDGQVEDFPDLPTGRCPARCQE